MNEEVIKRIFDPFFTTKFTGRGLGMSAMLGIIRAHAGAIKVSSQPKEGSCFDIYFPVSESSHRAATVADTTLTPSSAL